MPEDMVEGRIRGLEIQIQELKEKHPSLLPAPDHRERLIQRYQDEIARIRGGARPMMYNMDTLMSRNR